MKERWKEIPVAMKKQIFKRMGVGIGFMVIGIIAWISSQEFMFALPCFLGSIFFLLNGTGVLYAGLAKKFIVLCGWCEELEQTRILKRTKSAYLRTEYGRVKVPIRRAIRRLRTGSMVTCFMSVKASVYEYGVEKVLGDYYAIEIA